MLYHVFVCRLKMQKKQSEAAASSKLLILSRIIYFTMFTISFTLLVVGALPPGFIDYSVEPPLLRMISDGFEVHRAGAYTCFALLVVNAITICYMIYVCWETNDVGREKNVHKTSFMRLCSLFFSTLCAVVGFFMLATHANPNEHVHLVGALFFIIFYSISLFLITAISPSLSIVSSDQKTRSISDSIWFSSMKWTVGITIACCLMLIIFEMSVIFNGHGDSVLQSMAALSEYLLFYSFASFNICFATIISSIVYAVDF